MNPNVLFGPLLDGTADTESYLDTDTDDYYDDHARQYCAPPVDPYAFDEVLEFIDNH